MDVEVLESPDSPLATPAKGEVRLEMACDHIIGTFASDDSYGLYLLEDDGAPIAVTMVDVFDYCPKCGTRLTQDAAPPR